MKIGIDSYCYHRLFGEVYDMQEKPERGQEPGKKENPQESMPPDMPSGGSTENSSSEGGGSL